MESVDVTIVGAGVIGLAVAARLAREDRTVAILEKNPRHGQETSSRNSEVIHAGIYYVPGSLRAVLCVRGREMLYDYCSRHNLPFRKAGKLIAITKPEESAGLEKLYRLGLQNGVSDLSIIDGPEVRRLEPEINALAAILSPSTGIFSADAFMDALLKEAESRGAMLFTQSALTGITREKGGYVLSAAGQEPFFSRLVINCAGHGAPAVCAMAGIDIEEEGYAQKFIKGEYFRITARHAISHLIYPLPGEISLGTHLTPDLAGHIRVGPSAFEVPALDYTVDEAHRSRFGEAARLFLPAVCDEELIPDTAGVRPHLKRFAGPKPDFIIRHEADKGLEGFLTMVGMESPGLTSALAVAEAAEERLKDILR